MLQVCPTTGCGLLLHPCRHPHLTLIHHHMLCTATAECPGHQGAGWVSTCAPWQGLGQPCYGAFVRSVSSFHR